MADMTTPADLDALVAAVRAGDADSVPVLADALEELGDARALPVRTLKPIGWMPLGHGKPGRSLALGRRDEWNRLEDHVASVWRQAGAGAWAWQVGPFHGEEPSRELAMRQAERHLKEILRRPGGPGSETRRRYALARSALCRLVAALFPEFPAGG